MLDILLAGNWSLSWPRLLKKEWVHGKCQNRVLQQINGCEGSWMNGFYLGFGPDQLLLCGLTSASGSNVLRCSLAKGNAGPEKSKSSISTASCSLCRVESSKNGSMLLRARHRPIEMPRQWPIGSTFCYVIAELRRISRTSINVALFKFGHVLKK